MDGPSQRGSTPPEEKRPCWECLRRRLVCDFSRPTCKKCLKTGIVCPGYGNAKPLKWLTPGSVTFRRRKDVPTRSYPTSGSPSTTGSSPKSNSGSEAGSPSRRVENHLLRVPRVDLKCESTDIVQAYAYCTHCLGLSWLFSQYTLTDTDRTDNEQIYPAYSAASLCRSPYVSTVSLEAIGHSPSYLSHICASISLRHRVYRLSSTSERSLLAAMRLRYHHQRSLAIQALNENIAKAEKENPYVLIVGVNMFVFAEVRHSLKRPYYLIDLPFLWLGITYIYFVLAPAFSCAGVEVPLGCRSWDHNSHWRPHRCVSKGAGYEFPSHIVCGVRMDSLLPVEAPRPSPSWNILTITQGLYNGVYYQPTVHT